MKLKNPLRAVFDPLNERRRMKRRLKMYGRPSKRTHRHRRRSKR